MASGYEETVPKEMLISDSPSPDTSSPVSHENEGYAYQFVDETLSSTYECSFCLHVVRVPVLIPCGDIACSACWQRYVSSKELKNEEVTCPLCRQLISAEPVVKNKRMEREVKSLKVYCDNKSLGCGDSFELNNIEKHHQVCSYKTVSCRLSCGKSIILIDLEYHELKMCSKRLDRCNPCGMTMTLLELKTHDEVCPKKMIPCSLCEMKVSRDDLEAHQKETCLLYETNCAFSLTGCQKKIPRSQLDSHQTNHYNYHLNLLNRGFLSLSESLGALAYISEQCDAGKSTELPGHLVQYAALAEKTKQTGVPSFSMGCVGQMQNITQNNNQERRQVEQQIPEEYITRTTNISASEGNDINTAATVGILDKIKSLECLVYIQDGKINRLEKAIIGQEETISRQEKTIIRQEGTLIRHEKTLARQEETITKQEETIRRHEKTITRQEETVIKHEKTIARQEETISRHEKTIARQEETIIKQQEATKCLTTNFNLIHEQRGAVNAQAAKIRVLKEAPEQASVKETKETKSRLRKSFSGVHKIYKSGVFIWLFDVASESNLNDCVYFYSAFRLKCCLHLDVYFTPLTLGLFLCEGDYDDLIKFPTAWPVITGSIKGASTGVVLMELHNKKNTGSKLTLKRSGLETIDEWQLNSSVLNYISDKKPIAIEIYL